LGELGSIFEDGPAKGKGAKGPDVRVRAPITESMLAGGDEVLITVPDRIPHEGGTVPRRRGPGDRPGEVSLHLSPQLKDGVTLRLRGQGGEHPGSGLPGDLLVTIEVVPDPAAGMRWVLIVGLAAGAAGLTAWLSYGTWWG